MNPRSVNRTISSSDDMNDHEKSPKSVEEQDAPEPERPTTPDEEAGMDLAEMEDPPQAEGPRRETDGVSGDEGREKRSG